MANDEKLKVDIVGDATGVNQTFQQVQNKSKQTGQVVSSSFADAAKRIQQNQLVSQMETISALFIQMGGNVSRVASLVTSLIRPVATLGALVGKANIGLIGAFAAPAAAIGATVLVTKSLANSAIAARDELVDMGLAAKIPPDAVQVMRDYDAVAKQLTVSVDLFKIAIGEAAVEKMSRMSTAFVMLTDDTDDFSEAMASLDTGAARGGLAPTRFATAWDEATVALGKAYTAIQGMGEAWDYLNRNVKYLTGGAMREAVSEFFNGWVEKKRDILVEAQKETDEYRKQWDYIQNIAEAEDERRRDAAAAGARRAQELARQRREEAERAAEKRRRDYEAAKEEGTRNTNARIAEEKATKEAAKKLADEQRKVSDAIRFHLYKEKIANEELGKAAVEAREAGQAAIVAQERALDDYVGSFEQKIDILKQKWEEWGGFIAEQAQAAFDLVMRLSDLELEKDLATNEQKKQRVTDLYDKRKELVQELMDAETDAQRQSIQEDIQLTNIRINNSKILSDRAKQEAMEAWRRNRALQYAQTVLNGIAAFGQTLASSPLPFPANLWAAGFVASLVQAEALVIAATPPPEFPTGRSPDHAEIVAVQQGEPVLSRRAAASLGGVDAVRMLNEGRLPSNFAGAGSMMLEPSPELRRWFRVRNPHAGKRNRR